MVLESKVGFETKHGLRQSTLRMGGRSGRRWRTGLELAVGDSCSRAQKLYGQPASRGPSMKDGRELELLLYQFDWAGPDVPQVMEVLCTPEKEGKPGRVMEIMLARGSL